MNRRFISRTRVAPFLFSLGVAVGGASCANLEATFFEPKDSMALVDDLSERIEEVHVATEVSKERMNAAVEALRSMTSSDFRGDALVAHAELTRSIESSEEQAETLRDHVTEMKDTASELFERWAQDLEGFTNAEMRQSSQKRLEDTRTRYQTIVAAVDPALWSLDAVNRDLRDHALFLGHDFNKSAVASVRPGVEALGKQRTELDGRLALAMNAAHDYLESAAPPGAVAAEPPK